MDNTFVYTPIKPVDFSLEPKCWAHLDKKCMPSRSMGLLERVAVRIALAQNTLNPQIKVPYMFIGAADHGVMAQKVSFTPLDVSWQHSINMAHGGGVAGLMSRKHNIPLEVCDVGLNHDFEPKDNIVNCKVAYGTKDMSLEKAMTRQQCIKAMEQGRDRVANAYKNGYNAVIFGEMGAGNTTSAAAITSFVLNQMVDVCVGPGTGMGDNARKHKCQVVEKILALHKGVTDPIDIMASMGGLELSFIAGGVLEACGRGMVVLLDGYIVTAAVLIADLINKNVRDYLVACHVSNEPGHRMQLEHLGLEPLLRCGFCLGEGSGAILAWPLIQEALAIFNEMNTFDEGGLDDAVEIINTAKAND